MHSAIGYLTPADKLAGREAEIFTARDRKLAEGGILVIPLGQRDYQTLQAIRKVDGQPQTSNLSACRFVPLIGAQAWPDY